MLPCIGRYGLQFHSVPAVVLIVAGGEVVPAGVLFQLFFADGIADIGVGLHVLEDIVMFAEDTLGAGLVTGTVLSLLERGDGEGAILFLYGHAAGVVAARDGLEGVAGEVVVENPEVSPDEGMVCVLLFGGDHHQHGDAEFALCVFRPDFLCQVVADGIAEGLLLAAEGDMVDAVLLVAVEVGHEPLAVHLLHIELMFLYIGRFVERAVLPFLAHVDSCDCVGIIGFLHADDLVIRDGTAVACHEIVEPFVVHGLEFRQLVEHRVQNGIEIGGHEVLRLFQQFVVGDVFAQFGRTFLKLCFIVVACRKQQDGKDEDDDSSYDILFNILIYKMMHCSWRGIRRRGEGSPLPGIHNVAVSVLVWR